jgi:hypothetical protein
MSRRKGELSPNRVDREWPHQIMLPANDVLGQNYNAVHAFCADLSLCPRGHSIVKDDKWHHVFCFAEKNMLRNSTRTLGASGSTRQRGAAAATG